MNERLTEDIVEKRLRERGYYAEGSDAIVEKQQSKTTKIQKLLENASKRGKGAGRPEFIIQSGQRSDFIILIECKASPLKHASKSLDQFADFAVDGALLYASFLSKEFDVLAIGVSGENEAEYSISHYLHLKGTDKAVEFLAANDILSLSDYYNGFVQSGAKFRQDYGRLLDYSKSLNNLLQSKKIKEAQRGFLVSGVLIALQSKAFVGSFLSQKTSRSLAQSLVQTIRSEFENANLPEARRDNLNQAFSFISTHPALIQDKSFFVLLIEGIENNVNAFMRTYKYYDTIGQFYIEFLRFANNDKGLGIVLTPPHIAEMFARLADVSKHSIVFDNCCGTAGLLIAAMKIMMVDASSDSETLERIKLNQLFGVEFQDDIYALAVSNMVLHGDGKTNIFRGDCFFQAPDFPTYKPTVGVLNPPYKNKEIAEDHEELEFVHNNVEKLAADGICIAIVPITCATAPSGRIYEWKRTLLKRHTLEAVLSMPTDLFHNSKVGVITCVMIFRAHRPHTVGKKTWFGYCRNDGFVKTKHRGRVDINNTWAGIEKLWLSAYRNREVVPGFSVMREVDSEDEWCAEAYLDADYEQIDERTLLEAIKRNYMTRITGPDELVSEVLNGT